MSPGRGIKLQLVEDYGSGHGIFGEREQLDEDGARENDLIFLVQRGVLCREHRKEVRCLRLKEL